ncbi:glycoside hydrolase family 2 [Paraflavitalea soli]|uniref:Glycoside hydrolase family 2 n=1 Tax=Paraflavitalea soli TaxID=2315862 RepID=A0A3B7MTU4_9BACT|nr:sugar-binding domain-containing protein [Paraflavitalea soli]AXY77942.1 glycoside hydrolase family 2 [Paraflavitalea soli]
MKIMNTPYRSLCLAIAMLPLISPAQHLEYKEVFAPTESWVKAQEKPFRQDLCLNGSWQFQPVPLPAGFKEGIDKVPTLTAVNTDAWEKTPIRIPSPWNVNSFADKNAQGGDFRTYPSYPAGWENAKMGWLRKKFTVPAGWKGQRMQLHFEAIAGDAEIIVNGKKTGNHFGIFLPFDIDVTEAIIPGKENELLVGVRKASLFDKRSDYGRRTYQAGSFWGQHIAGIWQDVYLVALPPVHVADVYVNPKVAANLLEAELTVVNEGAADATITLSGKVFPWMAATATLSAKPALEIKPVTIKVSAHGQVKTTIVANVQGQLKYWSPQSPQLYGLVVQTISNRKIIDNKYTRFGWRQVTLKDDKVLLNGAAITMRGDSWHFLGIPQMTRRYAAAWYKAMRDANLNAVRLHAQPYPSFYLDVADEMGILVLDETAVWASDGGPKLNDPAYWQDSRTHLSELILRDRNHPSVFGWSVSNEVMPIVRGVMRNPPGMKDTLVKYYSVWADICRQLDPSRQWISADGEDDGEGHLPVYIVHYGGFDAMNRAKKSGKPWGVGEAGMAYYGTPEQVAATNGDRAYEDFKGRMEGVAASSYQSLIAQKERNAVYQSVFNMVWYGLTPVPFGMKDITRPPTLEDGVYFTHFKEGQPGVQPERLGPYCSTLNPGYDRGLPLYTTWPLFDAIRDAAANKVVSKWMAPKPATPAAPVVKPVQSVQVLAGEGGTLATALKQTGVLFTKDIKDPIPQLLFIDGAHPPVADSRDIIEKVTNNGGTVVVWGVSNDKLSALNQLLPAPLIVTDRTATSLVKFSQSSVAHIKFTDPLDSIVGGISLADLYFSELRPAEITTQGMSGALVQQSRVLLRAAPTDWPKWNKQPEYAKTGMVLRSGLEAKPAGAVLIAKRMGKGRLVVTTLPAAPRLAKAEKTIRMLLANLGTPLGTGSDAGKPLLKGGGIVRTLLSGTYPITSLQEAADKNFIDPAAGDAIKLNATVDAKPWTLLYEESGLVDFAKAKMDGPKNNAVAYLSFWVSSPRALDDLLIEPNIPIVNMEVAADDAVQVWLNGKRIINNIRNGDIDNGKAKADALKLHQGWNHFLIKVIQLGGEWKFTGRLTSNQPDFLADLESALQKP